MSETTDASTSARDSSTSEAEAADGWRVQFSVKRTHSTNRTEVDVISGPMSPAALKAASDALLGMIPAEVREAMEVSGS